MIGESFSKLSTKCSSETASRLIPPQLWSLFLEKLLINKRGWGETNRFLSFSIKIGARSPNFGGRTPILHFALMAMNFRRFTAMRAKPSSRFTRCFPPDGEADETQIGLQIFKSWFSVRLVSGLEGTGFLIRKQRSPSRAVSLACASHEVRSGCPLP